MKRSSRLALTILGASLLAGLATAQVTELASVAGDGTPGDAYSYWAAVSADGRFVAFTSQASNLVPGPTSDWQIYVRDRAAGTTERVSVADDGTEGSGPSWWPELSADGRFVAFMSASGNLVPGDTNGKTDVFVRDRLAGTTERVSIAKTGAQANDQSGSPSISPDGRYVAFDSPASNLVLGDTNNTWDVFVRDRLTGTTERVSVASDGTQASSESSIPSISADGRFVAFRSSASNLVPGDSNGFSDVFLRDRVAGTTERVSVATGGEEGNHASEWPSISADGRHVAFASLATNLVPGNTSSFRDIFVRDRLAGTTERASVASDGTEANGDSFRPSISADGRHVAFESRASNLVPDDTNGVDDIFVHDRVSGNTERASIASDGTQGLGMSIWGFISDDGRYVVFESLADELVPESTNVGWDVFVRDRGAPPPAPSPFCFGDGTGTPCPCANTGALGHGCRNGTFARGAVLSAAGDASVSADTLVLLVARAVPGQPGLFFQGDEAVHRGSGVHFGDGLRCAEGNRVGFRVHVVDGSGSASSSIPIAAAGGVSAGDVKRYQWWYRDPTGSPCLTGFNLSNGLEVTWGP